MTLKKMRKLASKGGFTLKKSNAHSYKYMMINNRTQTAQHYAALEDIRPDIEEIMEGMTPFA